MNGSSNKQPNGGSESSGGQAPGTSSPTPCPPDASASRAPQAFTPDQRAAHAFLTELRTRIATQKLPYQFGREDRALESLVELFGAAREIMRKETGCEHFAQTVSDALNTVLRPFTAKWHRLAGEGVLASRDGGDLFRSELTQVQTGLRQLARGLHQMAYETQGVETDAPPVMPAEELDELFAPLKAGIPEDTSHNGGIDANTAKNINQDEASDILARRTGKPPTTASSEASDIHNTATPPTTNPSESNGIHNAVGLALSGGGIRSATFCLGAVQVLAEKRLFREVDFLSTVSGGGYTGTFLTQQIGKQHGKEDDVASPGGPDTAAIRQLRMRAKYLSSGSLWNAWRMATVNVFGMMLNWTVPLLALTLCAALFMAFWKYCVTLPWARLILGSFALATCFGLLHYILLRLRHQTAAWSGWAFGALAAAGLLFTVGAGLESVLEKVFLPENSDGFATPVEAWSHLHRKASLLTGYLGIGGLSLGALSVILPAVLRFVPALKTPAVRRMVAKAALIVAGIFVPLLGIFVFCLLCTLASILSLGGTWFLVGLATFLTLVAIFVLNINLTGPHQLYRAALSRTFVELDGHQESPALPTINPAQTAPLHLLNATVNLPTSRKESLRERKCDFFLFSKRWIGSPASGYRPAGEWRCNGQPADLATAMAVSGAAVSSSMGLGSVPPLRALLTFLNIRLGFWIRRPDAPGLWGLPNWQHAGFLCLLREMSGLGMAEDHRWLNLSDGGHIENLGIYELLRRRCKFIIAIDGEADPGHTFHGLLTLIRHARIDLGIRIEPGLSDLRPQTGTGNCRTHCHFSRIHYPKAENSPAGEGLLLYLKLSLTGDESELIRRYRGLHPEFPHQNTLDQFFDQEQFEAYRQLGVHAMEGLFLPAITSGLTSPPTVPAWFRSLASNLLTPADP
jgi:hypothetical protein